MVVTRDLDPKTGGGEGLEQGTRFQRVVAAQSLGPRRKISLKVQLGPGRVFIKSQGGTKGEVHKGGLQATKELTLGLNTKAIGISGITNKGGWTRIGRESEA